MMIIFIKKKIVLSLVAIQWENPPCTRNCRWYAEQKLLVTKEIIEAKEQELQELKQELQEVKEEL